MNTSATRRRVPSRCVTPPTPRGTSSEAEGDERQSGRGCDQPAAADCHLGRMR